MNSNPISHVEVDERAFAIFLLDGIYYLLQQDTPLRRESIINFCTRLWTRWVHMSENEKDPYWERAMEELRRIRRYSHVDIYREAIRDNIPDNDDQPRHVRRFLDRSS